MANQSSFTALDLAYRLDVSGDLEDLLNESATSGRVATVRADTPALELAEQVDKGKPHVVRVLDDEDVVCGYVFPDWVKAEIAGETAAEEMSLTDAITIVLTQDLDLKRTHFNTERPTRAMCPGGPPGSIGEHLTFGPVPCSRHR